MMADIGLPELFIILAIAIILFGPARIGGIGKSLGEAISGFREAIKDENEQTPVNEDRAPAPTAAAEDRTMLAESAQGRE
jgi:sec-independent protein translocase protein TatA